MAQIRASSGGKRYLQEDEHVATHPRKPSAKGDTSMNAPTDMRNPSSTPSLAGRREWIGLAVLALPTLLLALDISVLYLALPHLSADLQPSSTQQLWIMDIYGFMIAGFLVTMGTLGDRIGRRRLLMIGGTAFAIASILAAYSSSAPMLIAMRALLGIAGATLMPSTLALISNMFRDPTQRGQAIAIWMSCFMVGTIIGPLVGGVLLEQFWWGAAFLLGVPVMGLLLVTAPVLLPEYRAPNAGRLDLASVALSLGTILPIIYGLKEFAKYGLQGPSLVAVVIGLALGLVFVRRQRTLADPLLDLNLFRNRAFSVALASMLSSGIIMSGTFLFVTLYLQMVAGLPPLQAGLWLVPQSLAMIAGSMLAPAFAKRLGPVYVMAGGLAVAAFGLVLLTQLGTTNGLPLLVVANLVIVFGMGPLGVLCTELVVGSAPPEKAGSAASMSESSAEFGIALGVATLGSLGTTIYRAQLAITIPSGLPADAAEAARESITGAAIVSEGLPALLGPALLAATREAFTSGLNVVTGAGAALFAVLAILIVIQLRHVHPAGEAEAPAGGTDTVPISRPETQPAVTRGVLD
jgi:DHA2 family multidrug resistance protein-like MFS transporter